jgi:ABC-type glycerol-3-phosphate transport system substrate-binding protein
MGKRITRRQFLRGAAAGAAGVVLASCATPTAEVVEKETTVEVEVEKLVTEIVQETVEVPVEVEVEVEVPVTAVPPEEVTIQIWDYDPTGTDAWVRADKSFEAYFHGKYPYITAERTQAPWTGFAEKFLTSVAGGATYDVIYGWYRWLPQFMENNTVAPIDELVDVDPEVEPGDFLDSAKEIVDGKTYGLSWYVGASFLWYNKSRVAEAGVDDPHEVDMGGNWTYDAYYEFGEAMTGERDGGPVYGADVSWTRSAGPNYNLIARAFGGTEFDETFTTCTMDSPEHLEVWKFLQRFYMNGISPTPGAMAEETIGFDQENVISWVTGNWYIDTATQAGLPSIFDIGMARMPEGPSGQFTSTYINSFYMGADAQNPMEGWIWYKERSWSEAALTIYVPIGNGRFPALKRLEPQYEYDWENVEMYDALRPTMVAYTVSPKESEFNGLFEAAYDEMILQTRPIEDILGQLAEETTDLMQE